MRRVGTLIEKDGETPDISLSMGPILSASDRADGYTERPVYVLEEDEEPFHRISPERQEAAADAMASVARCRAMVIEPAIPEEMPEGYFGDPE